MMLLTLDLKEQTYFTLARPLVEYASSLGPIYTN
jgi:hypothetical protein